METLCGADCGKCPEKDTCGGCVATGGHPFGGRCVAAEYVRVGGREAYRLFREQLRAEINALLSSEGLPPAEELHELPGTYVNLPYTLPGGAVVRFLDDKNVYLGCQIAFADLGVCYGVVADTTFILICRYSKDGTEPQILIYKTR